MNYVTFFGSARSEASAFAYEAVRNLAYEIACEGCGIITGGGAGIMQAANEGAARAGAASIGINVRLPHEQRANEFCSEVKFHTDISLRKKELIARASGIIVCAGGFGTLDELFEVLTLNQTGLDAKPLVLFGAQFWRPLDGFLRELIAAGLADAQPLYLLSDDAAEIKNYLNIPRRQQ